MHEGACVTQWQQRGDQKSFDSSSTSFLHGDNLSEGTGGKLRTGSNFPHVAGRCRSIFQASGKV